MIDIDVLIAKGSGLAGAVLSLNFVKGTWPERITMAIGGAIVSLYVTPFAAQKTSLPESLAGFLLGMFGMAITAKVWELIQATPISDLWVATINAIKTKLGA